MAFDLHTCSEEQAELFSIQVAIEYPVTTTDRSEVFLLHPPFAFVGMPSFGPAPDGLEDCMVDFSEGVFAADRVGRSYNPYQDGVLRSSFRG